MLPGKGRYLTLADVGTRNTVISQQIADEFHVGVGDPLTVNGYELKIVGIYNCHSLLLDVAIVLDIDQVRTMTRFGENSVSSYYMEQTGTVDDELLIRNIGKTFQDRKLETWQPSETVSATSLFPGWLGKLIDLLIELSKEFGPAKMTAPATAKTPPDANLSPQSAATATGPLEVRKAVDWAERFSDLTADLNLFLGVLTAIGVTIAVLSIVNTMLMSVSERFIEFGILKANGWTRGDVLSLITFESAVLGLGGGVLGAILGWVAVQFINSRWPERVQLYASPGLLAFAVLFATVLGMLGGLYPAIWAMRMSPMEAIRRG
jgi:putative ABC transport system permease protein